MKQFFNQNDFFSKSLKTSNLANANKYAKILLHKINYIKQSIKMKIDSVEILKMIEDLANTTFEETEKDLYNIDKVEDTTFALKLEDTIKSYKNAYSEQNYTLVQEEAKNILKSLNLAHSESSFNEICKLLLQSHIENLKTISSKIDNGDYYKVKPVVVPPSVVLTPPIPKEKVVEEKNISVEEAYNKFEAYFEEQEKWSKDTKDGNIKYFSFFCKIVGKNKNVKTLKMIDFINYHNKLALEKHNNILLSLRTKNKYITLSNKFLKYLRKYEFIEKEIYLDRIKIDGKELLLTKKETYSIEELEKWYKYALNEAIKEEKWIILLALFNGLSISEIVRMEKKNVFIQDDIWCIEVELTEEKDTKNFHRIRTIPLHKALIELGFLEFVNGFESGNLFEIDNKSFSRKMTNVNRKYISTNKKRTFHRLRANFIDTLIQNSVQVEHIISLVGHSQEYKMGFDSYSNKINVSVLAIALEKINYKFE
jgi:integrase